MGHLGNFDFTGNKRNLEMVVGSKQAIVEMCLAWFVAKMASQQVLFDADNFRQAGYPPPISEIAPNRFLSLL
jgi:hypothetical protein